MVMLCDAVDQLHVGCLRDANDLEWDHYVRAQPLATFFHLSGWKAVVEESLNHACYYLVARQAAKIVGVLPLTHVRSKLFGDSLISNGFCVYGGPVVESPAALQALDAAAIDLAKDLRVGRIEYRLRRPLHSNWHCNRETYVTFRKQIDRDPMKELVSIPRKQRAMVRKGMKHGLKGVVNDNVHRFYPLYAESIRNLGTPVLSRRYFECLKSVFASESEIITVMSGGQPLTSVLSFFFQDEVLPYYGGGSGAARECAANDFMYWEVMRRACEAGVRVFDFGRSKVGTGSFAFKRHWGFDPEPLHYENHLLLTARVPEINPLNPRYALMIAAWKRLPLSVTNAIGPFVARELA
jgi:FemAB-related protein (PEP-CTERM system-associated)